MTVRGTAIIILWVAFSYPVFSQQIITQKKADSSSFLSAFSNGRIKGQFRYFFMGTDNEKSLSDYHAHAIGGGLSYKTASFRGFRLGMGGFFIFNSGSSDFMKPDPSTKQYNRYEIGLFDIENPSGKQGINRLEELYISYGWKKSTVTIGRQMINTPFINPQDGRMRPTFVEGAWLNTNLKKVKLDAGLLWGISPRSTVRWFNIGSSIGIYPQGVNEAGNPSDYKGYISSRFIGLVGIQFVVNPKLKWQVWNQLTDRVFNTLLIQGNQQLGGSENKHYYTAIQFITQQSMGNGGNDDPAHRYMEKNGTSVSFGLKMGWKQESQDISLSYTRITKQGRFLMPREWGREPLFTFLPRERNEGFGDVNAFLLLHKKQFGETGFQSQIGLGYYQLPDVLNTRLNKYGMPSYTQLNIDLQYDFSKYWKGAQLAFLYVYKSQKGNSYHNDKYVINKVNTSLFNLILNYRF